MALVDQRSRLLHMRAEHIAQRRVQQMRAGVVAHGRPPQLAVDHRIDPSPTTIGCRAVTRCARTPCTG